MLNIGGKVFTHNLIGMDRNLNQDHNPNILGSSFYSWIYNNQWNSGKAYGFSLESLIN